MKFFGYFRSSTSYRVRIALNLKGLEYDIIPVNLLKTEQKGADYTALNPQQRVPTLVDGEHTLMQSLAIMEYLEEKYPNPPILPQTAPARARVRAIALGIACDISPLGNLGPLRYLSEKFGVSDEQKSEWIRHWISEGFAAMEKILRGPETGSFCHGATPTIADCCLVPQLFTARRFKVDLAPFPTLTRIAGHCEKHPAFIAAHPSRQPDAA